VCDAVLGSLSFLPGARPAPRGSAPCFTVLAARSIPGDSPCSSAAPVCTPADSTPSISHCSGGAPWQPDQCRSPKLVAGPVHGHRHRTQHAQRVRQAVRQDVHALGVGPPRAAPEAVVVRRRVVCSDPMWCASGFEHVSAAVGFRFANVSGTCLSSRVGPCGTTAWQQ
jgi:hypothetical protein